MNKKVLLSGIQPSGRPHIGNYFAMMKQVVDNQNKYKNYIAIVDYHAFTTLKDGKEMSKNIVDVAIDFLAIGLDPKKVVFFKQSDVMEHVELGWIFNCVTPISLLERSHAFKDAMKDGKKEITSGLFTYPVLQAADIALYDTEIVPVGKDQQQHIEMGRVIIRKFNNIFGKVFQEPKALIMKEVALIPGTDGKKMSKSYKNTIPLFATEKEIKEIIRKIPMDSKLLQERKNPDDYNLYKIFKLFATKSEDKKLRKMFQDGGIGYGDIKIYVVKVVSDYLKPFRQERKRWESKRGQVLKILKNGGKTAKKSCK